MQKYFFGNPATIRDHYKSISDKKKQKIIDRDKKISILYIKSLLSKGISINDFEIQMEMESNGITLDDLK